MKTSEVRKRFLRFFEEREHAVVASSPLVPDDPTLLFTNAGMVQFKDTFLGMQTRSYSRATSVQKCMRVTGKHNDLENVGPSPRHHTFFEMLGNFSFGDYFKPEAIRYGWDFLSGDMELPPDRLVVTVFEDDDEAYDEWTRTIGFPSERVLRMGESTNFWMMADVGPCGPTTEIHYDFGPEKCTCHQPNCSVELDNDCGRWLEVWNIVFMQYDQSEDGTRSPLPQTGVDTGLGLERLAAIKQGVYSNYQTDLFQPILNRVQKLTGHSDRERAENVAGYRVLGDHGRAMAFLVADGVLPGNDGRNYVLRLIMRRAMRFGKLLGLHDPFMVELSDAVIENMAPAYPELKKKSDWIREVVAEEEARFERTLDTGMVILDRVIEQAGVTDREKIPGSEVFRLYDTYGFPPDLTLSVAREHGLGIDRAGFDDAMAEQRDRARSGGRFGVEEGRRAYSRMGLPETEFVGYESFSCQSKVVAIRLAGEGVSQAGEGSEVEVVLDRTPFYAEAGGQIGDCGVLRGGSGVVRVTDSQAPIPGLVVHYGEVHEGTLAVGDEVVAEIDAVRRRDTMRNHTVTHLLHRALQEVLGDHAQQRGSLVGPDKMRFDFAHLKALKTDELEAVESKVNESIRLDASVTWEHVALEEARQSGAMMLFGEKYLDVVRVVSIEGLSKELCGGTHVGRTGEIGTFVITHESSVGSGLRRIEALTGRGAHEFVRDRLGLLETLAEKLGTPNPDAVALRIDELQERVHQLSRDLDEAQSALAAAQAEDLSGGIVDVGGVQVVARQVHARDAESLRNQADAIRDRLASGVVVLGSVVDGSPRLVATMTADLVERGLHSGRLAKQIARMIGGGGGGRPHLAEAGGSDAEALGDALAAVSELVQSDLEGESSPDD